VLVQNNPVPDDASLAGLVEELAAVLLAREQTLTAAESCTGGWIAKVCTDRAGSSGWFDRGFVTYSNASKQVMLGVDSSMLSDFGAVSREVALKMAQGAQARAGTNIAVAVTGVAGPAGGTPDKPVGTVWFAWAYGASLDAELQLFPGDRDAVRRQTVQYALQGLIDRL
jgi:nicotinamide-nucleotide amidase